MPYSNKSISIKLVLITSLTFIVLIFLLQIVIESQQVRLSSSTIMPAQSYLKKLGSTDQSFNKMCDTYINPEFGADSRTCYATLNTYFENKDTDQMKQIMVDLVHNFEDRDFSINKENSMVDSYGFDSGNNRCYIKAGYENPDASRDDRLNRPSEANQRGHIKIECRVAVSIFFHRLGLN